MKKSVILFILIIFILTLSTVTTAVAKQKKLPPDETFYRDLRREPSVDTTSPKYGTRTTESKYQKELEGYEEKIVWGPTFKKIFKKADTIKGISKGLNEVLNRPDLIDSNSAYIGLSNEKIYLQNRKIAQTLTEMNNLLVDMKRLLKGLPSEFKKSLASDTDGGSLYLQNMEMIDVLKDMKDHLGSIKGAQQKALQPQLDRIKREDLMKEDRKKQWIEQNWRGGETDWEQNPKQ